MKSEETKKKISDAIKRRRNKNGLKKSDKPQSCSDKFKAEILQLMKKYDVKLERYDDFDGEENWCGCYYDFVGPEINVAVSELDN